MYSRIIKQQILDKFFQSKSIIVIGPRQVGKTTMVNELLAEGKHQNSLISFNCDNPTDRDKLNDKNFEYLKLLVGDKKIIFIDEAQKVKTIGQTIKLLVDNFKKEKQIIATGSSSINLLDMTQEPLTGRKIVFKLFPLSLEELYPDKNLLRLDKELEMLLIYGSYPDIINAAGLSDKEDLLKELSASYLYKDILEFQQVRNADAIHSLLKALALQVGSEVSYNELAKLIGLDKKTIERYIDLLEKNFIIFRLPPFYKNKRRAISRLKKIYFYDLGIRNAIINNFNQLSYRQDTGALWENFCLAERIKYQAYHKLNVNNYFLRTYDGAEIDLIEERGGSLNGYEFKWKNRLSDSSRRVGEIKYQFVSPENIKGFII